MKKKDKGAHQNINIKCKNGPSCRFFKEDRCNYQHEEPLKKQQRRKQQQSSEHPTGEQPWQTVEPRRHRRDTNQQTTGARQLSDCRNGPSCKFFKNIRCNFYHSQTTLQAKQQRQERSHPGSGGQGRDVSSCQLKQCKWGTKCDKGRTCTFLHLATDFFPSQAGRRN